MILEGYVKGRGVPRYSFRWKGYLDVFTPEGEVRLYMPGSVAQWLKKGEKVKVLVEELKWVYLPQEFSLERYYDNRWVKVWPPFSDTIVLERRDPLTGSPLYSYRIKVREAIYQEDFELIAELEQYHYASQKDKVAIWWCNGEYVEANVKPGEDCILVEIKGSLPVSRFLVAELLDREPYEPPVVGYVRIDPPIPLMHRRVNGKVEKYIRERVFPREWFHPTYWPERLLRELLKRRKGSYLDRKRLFEEVRVKAISICNTAVSRISRVVVHPDYRGEGIGRTIVKAAVQWIDGRDVPEMRKKKVLVETIAQMARYNPFFEKTGFIYLWDTASGRPVLYYPLNNEAKVYIERFLREDPVARRHGGKLYRPSLTFPDPISSPIILKDVTKMYESVLDVEGLPEDIRDVLLAFGVSKRVVQRYVLKGVDLEVKPGEVVVVVGLSGAGKTTLLRILSGLVQPDRGEVIIPSDARIGVWLPGEVEPSFGNKTILEEVYENVGDVVSAIELLNMSGLSDAIFYRAHFEELSTGQKERARLALLLSKRPNVVIIDEFTAHLDTLTAVRVGRKLSELLRRFKITGVIVTHRNEVVKVLNPDKIIYVGYGGVTLRRLHS